MTDLRTLPGVGPSIAEDLLALGYRRAEDLRGADPEAMYQRSNRLAGVRQDPCLLYAFRCAVYCAENEHPDPELRKWWMWKDRRLQR